MIIKKHIEIAGCNGRKISIDYRGKVSAKKLRPLVYVHGYKGFKDWGLANEVAEQFAQNDFFYIKFNFSHNGVTAENPVDFVDLEAFGNNNYWIEFQELGLVIDWLEQADLPIDFSKLAVIGHSRGGGITLLRAAQDTRIQKAITWASVCDFEKRFPEDVSEWKDTGVQYVLNGRTEQMMPLYYQFYESYFEHEEELSILDQCKKIEAEVLVIHGDNDLGVPFKEAETIHSLVKKSQLIKVEKAGHTFEVSHPAQSKNIPTALKEVVKNSILFLR